MSPGVSWTCFRREFGVGNVCGGGERRQSASACADGRAGPWPEWCGPATAPLPHRRFRVIIFLVAGNRLRNSRTAKGFRPWRWGRSKWSARNQLSSSRQAKQARGEIHIRPLGRNRTRVVCVCVCVRPERKRGRRGLAGGPSIPESTRHPPSFTVSLARPRSARTTTNQVGASGLPRLLNRTNYFTHLLLLWRRLDDLHSACGVIGPRPSTGSATQRASPRARGRIPP